MTEILLAGTQETKFEQTTFTKEGLHLGQPMKTSEKITENLVFPDQGVVPEVMDDKDQEIID